MNELSEKIFQIICYHLWERGELPVNSFGHPVVTDAAFIPAVIEALMVPVLQSHKDNRSDQIELIFDLIEAFETAHDEGTSVGVAMANLKDLTLH